MNLKLFCDIAMSQAKVWIPKMTPKEFSDVLDKHTNKDLFEKKNRWEPKFKIK